MHGFPYEHISFIATNNSFILATLFLRMVATLECFLKVYGSNTFSFLQNRMESETVLSNTPKKDMQKLGIGKRKDSAQRSRQYHLHQKFTKLLDEGTSVRRQVHKSLAISNAVELLKLVFLSTSTAPELQNLLAETLRRYSEHDLFAAFSYLRVKKILVKYNFLFSSLLQLLCLAMYVNCGQNILNASFTVS